MANVIAVTNKTAVVTGGAGGIGGATARRLLASGAEVVVWDNLESPRAEEADGVTYVSVDVRDEASVARACDETVAKHGKVDILINGAGVTGPAKPMADYTYAEWQNVFEVNVGGTFLVTRSLLPQMMKLGWGRIVNIASVAGKEGNPNMTPYSASKAAVIGMTKALGRELALTGILVNAVAPGIIETSFLGGLSAEAIAFSRGKVPMDRLGQPDEVAALVTWLASDQCSFSTGAVYDASGGRATY